MSPETPNSEKTTVRLDDIPTVSTDIDTDTDTSSVLVHSETLSREAAIALLDVLIEPEEDTMRDTEIRELTHLGGGVSVTKIAWLADGSKAVFKPASGEMPMWEDAEKGEQAKRERAAYIISKVLDFDIAPATVIREIDGEPGSLQDFLEDFVVVAIMRSDFVDQSQYREDVAMLWLYDYIIWNGDRHQGNFMTNLQRIMAIDNGVSFSQKVYRPFGLIKDFHNQAIPPAVVEKLQRFNDWAEGMAYLEQELAPLLPEDDLKACLSRVRGVVDTVLTHGTIPPRHSMGYTGIEEA